MTTEDRSAAFSVQLQTGLDWLQAHYNIDITPSCTAMLLHYLELLVKWNRVYNLTAVRDPHSMISRHLLDSLVLAHWLTDQQSSVTGQTSAQALRVIDVGSGAGLPVLPLAIIRPDISFVSVESNGKKTRFQRQAVLELGLGNVDILNERVERVQCSASVVVSRAFTNPENFLHIASTLCNQQGRVILMLGKTEPLPDPLPSPYTLEALQPVDIPGSECPRHIVVCRRSKEFVRE